MELSTEEFHLLYPSTDNDEDSVGNKSQRHNNSAVAELDIDDQMRQIYTYSDEEDSSVNDRSAFRPEMETSDKHSPMTVCQIYKNVFVISAAFLCLFTAFQSLQNLQSTLNKEDGLGTGGLALIYCSSILSVLFLPSLVMWIIGCKWTMTLPIICYMTYIIANYHAVWATIGPASIILGLGGALLWTSQCMYLSQLATWYAELTNTAVEHALNWFFGIFLLIFQSTQIWGNLISSLVFTSNRDIQLPNTPENVSLRQHTCGANFFPENYANNTNLERPSAEKVNILCSIYLAFAFVAFCIMAIFLDKITLDTDTSNGDSKKDKKNLVCDLFLKTIKHMWFSTDQKLMVPLMVYGGFEQVFIAADFTESYVSCTMGIGAVGYIMMSYGITNGICSLVFGRLVKFTGRIFFFLLLFVIHGSCHVGLLLWKPHPDQLYVFYLFTVLWAMGDAITQTQFRGFTGAHFTENKLAAFSNLGVCEGAGFFIAFGYSSHLYTSTKLYICITFLTIGILSYLIIELRGRSKKEEKHYHLLETGND